MIFTDEKKVEKFNEILAEYGRLLSYRSNLANIINDGGINVIEKRSSGDNPGSYILIPHIVKMSPEKTNQMLNEIKSLDIIISFIDNVVYRDGAISNKVNLEENENKHQHTEISNREEDLELSGND